MFEDFIGMSGELMVAFAAGLSVGFFFGVWLMIRKTVYLIKSGKRVPKYLRDIGIEMPNTKS